MGSKTILSGVAASVLLLSAIAAGSVTVSVATTQPGAQASSGMVGLSYETSLLLPSSAGVHYFRPQNKPLLQLFKTIGVKSLRIGGSSVDAPKVPIPSDVDVTSLFEFARAAGVKVIYSVRLEESDKSGTLPPSTAESNARAAAEVARLIGGRYADVLDCFAIGNEPNYFSNWDVYSAKWLAIHDAIVAAYPAARFCAPDQNPSPVLDKRMVERFGNGTDRLVEISQHSYPFGCSYKNPGAPGVREDPGKLIPQDAGKARQAMLSPTAYNTYQKIYDGIESAIAHTPITYRLSECNSYWFSGLMGASDRYVSALWATDYLHWWADHAAAALNFHNGDRTGGDPSMPCRYAAFVTSGQGYEVRPLAYGMKLYTLSGDGNRLSVNTVCTAAENIAAYATLSDGHELSLTLINKASSSQAAAAAVHIRLDQRLRGGTVRAIFLLAKNNDIAAGSGEVTLGGEPIQSDGSWNGRWAALSPSAVGTNTIDVTVPPASAVVIKAILR